MPIQTHKFESTIRYAIPNRFELRFNLVSNHQFTALYGPSGAGKTTILKLIAGWLESKTTVSLFGSRLDLDESGRALALSDRRVGMVFQDDLLFPHLDVLKNARFAINFAKRENRMDATKFELLVRNFGIDQLLGRQASNLSGGERQRVGLVRALAAKPKLLLCDEPVCAIDRAGRAEVLGHLKRWAETEQIVMIMVTHDHDEIRRFAGHVWHIDAGCLVAEGSPESVLNK
ncbi:MAG: ATP-binding cassette domain-containing protein [Planctomycetota bacterium]|nr:ATP-binding cassette domain-containing protein [Planctomycetota bacterium]